MGPSKMAYQHRMSILVAAFFVCPRRSGECGLLRGQFLRFSSCVFGECLRIKELQKVRMVLVWRSGRHHFFCPEGQKNMKLSGFASWHTVPLHAPKVRFIRRQACFIPPFQTWPAAALTKAAEALLRLASQYEAASLRLIPP